LEGSKFPILKDLIDISQTDFDVFNPLSFFLNLLFHIVSVLLAFVFEGHEPQSVPFPG
jgi:hypothetical protein